MTTYSRQIAKLANDMKCPPIAPILIIADDAHLAARLSAIYATPRSYLAVVDGPRMPRPDQLAEVTRRCNAAAHVKAETVFFAGISEEADLALAARLPPHRVSRVVNDDDVRRLLVSSLPAAKEPISWGPERIGIGLLKALRQRRPIVFDVEVSPEATIKTKSGHWVVCEAGEDLSEVIAANYAFALGAGLIIIPEVSAPVADEIQEAFYGLYDRTAEGSQSDRLRALKNRLRGMCGEIPVTEGGSITFISKDLPYGFAFPEVPSTHLFKYPDLGVATVNGLSAEQPKTRGCNVAVLVDPETTDAPEIEAAKTILPNRRIFVRGYQGRGANVRAVSEMVDFFPYDLLIFATHCGDPSGYRWTYEFLDTEGHARKLVVDIALGVGRTDNPDILEVMQFQRFHSLDGIDWNDQEKKAKLYVGTAIRDFIDLQKTERLKPTKRETVERVIGSAALRMADNNYIPMPQISADHAPPVVINNACASWLNLAGRFTYGGARAYVGTLFQVSTTEARDVVVGLMDKHFGKVLSHAVWSSQNSVYGDHVRRPYIVTGVYPQRIRSTHEDVPNYLMRQLSRSLAGWRARRDTVVATDADLAERLQRVITYYEKEVRDFKAAWFPG